MKIEDYINAEKAQLDNIERAFLGIKHTMASESTLIELLQAALNMIDVEQEIVERIAMAQKSTRLARGLALRTDQLLRVRATVVQALGEAANTEIDV
jgi:hypothetical protein